MSRDLAPSSNPVSRSSLFRKVEKAFVVLALLFYADAGLNLLTGDTRIPAGDQKRLELQLALYALAAIFILPCWKQMLRAATKLKLVLGILPLAFISILWSDSPRYTCTHALWLCATTAFALYFGVRFRRREQVSLVVLALAIAGVASIALGIFAPQYSVDHTFHQGQWRGVFSTKNSLGKAMSMEWAGALLIFSTNRTLARVSTSDKRRQRASPKRSPVQYRSKSKARYKTARNGGRSKWAASLSNRCTSFSDNT